MKKNSNNRVKLSEKQKNLFLEELWENAAFVDELYPLFSGLVSQGELDNKTIKSLFENLTTIRNRNLITANQQKKLQQTCVGFFGLSVGSHGALTWTMIARPNTIKISDPDIVSPSNLNRLRLPWSSIGGKKVDIFKRQIIDMNPYINVITLESTTPNDMVSFFTKSPKVDIIIDEIDSLIGKITLRKIAKQKQIPLISVTDVGDNLFVDIERHDLESVPYFLGRVKNIENINFEKLTFTQRLRLVYQIVGLDENSIPMLESLKAIGKDLATWPQLGSTATMSGGAIAMLIKKIILNEEVKSGRYIINFDKIFVNDYNNPKVVKKQQELKKSILESLESHG